MVLRPERGWGLRRRHEGSGQCSPALGYRLPTEAEWEYTCRAGTLTSRYYGNSVELLRQYAWYEPNSLHHAQPAGSLLPNDLGLFDTLGNVFEWCHDRSRSIRPRMKKNIVIDEIDADEVVAGGVNRMLRGVGSSI